MADFRQELNPTSDPNYIRQSKEPDRIKPLELVSVPANTIADTRFGTLLQGVGNVAELGLTLTDNTIKRNLLDDAHNKIDPIQDQHGSSLLPGDVIGIAGTGAKGRARIAAASQYNLFGDGGAGTSSYAPTDAQRDYAGLPPEITNTPKPLPAGASQEITRVSRMNEAYNNGSMSDSYYNAQLVAVTKELRARYPGYRDEVDAAVSQITGVQPANALRKSLLSDLNANASARAAGMNDTEKLYQRNAEAIVTVAPDFFTNRAAYAGRETAVLTQAYQLGAERSMVTADVARLGLDKSRTTQVATDVAVNEVRAGVARINNWQDPKDGKTLNQKLNELQARGGGTPEEIAGIVNTLENMKRQLSQGIDERFTTLTVPGRNGQPDRSLAAFVGENAGTAKTAALAPIDAAIAQVKVGNIGMLKTITDRLDVTKTTEAQRQIDEHPPIKFVAGLSKAGGEAIAGQVFQGTQLLPSLQKSLAEDKLLKTMAGTNDAPMSKQLEDMKKAGAYSGPAQRALVSGNMEIMKSDKFGTEASAAAVRNLFDQKFFAGVPEDQQMRTFLWMAKPENTARIAELDKKSPGLLQQYKQWSEYAANVVVSRGISAARDAAEDDRFKIDFNPKTLQIEMTPKEGMTNKLGVGRGSNIGQAYVKDVNQALAIMKPIWAASGADPLEAARSWISANNIRTESAGYEPNPVFKQVGKTLHDMFLGPSKDGVAPTAPPPGLEPHQTRGVIRGNLSDTPEGAPVNTN
jgi:hypothetical protein